MFINPEIKGLVATFDPDTDIKVNVGRVMMG